MSWIGPCWLLKIVPWYFLKGKTPHHMHKKSNMPYTTTSPIPPTNFPDRSKAMRQKRIYNIEWVLRWWFSAYHCEQNVSLYDARCTYHKWNWEIFQLAAHNNQIFQLAAHNNHPHSNNRRTNCHTWKNIYHIEWALRKWLACYLWAKRISMYNLTNVKMSVFFSWLHITINLIPQTRELMADRELLWWLFVICFVPWMMTDYLRLPSFNIYFYLSIPKC